MRFRITFRMKNIEAKYRHRHPGVLDNAQRDPDGGYLLDVEPPHDERLAFTVKIEEIS